MSPAYIPLASEADYRQACDAILQRAQRQILIFDRDLARLRLEEKARLEALARFVQDDGARRIRMVLHDPQPLECNAPRLLQLIRRFSSAIEVRQSPGNLHHVADAHVLADASHGVRRFHVDHARSALVFDDPAYIGPWWKRFEELWELSHPCVRINRAEL